MEKFRSPLELAFAGLCRRTGAAGDIVPVAARGIYSPWDSGLQKALLFGSGVQEASNYLRAIEKDAPRGLKRVLWLTYDEILASVSYFVAMAGSLIEKRPLFESVY